MNMILVKHLARYNIDVNSVNPGFIREDDCKSSPEDVKLLGLKRYPSSAIKRIVCGVSINVITTG